MSLKSTFPQGLITYILPLRSCNTMSTDVEEGMEYFNTVVVQPHRKLVTNQVLIVAEQIHQTQNEMHECCTICI